MIGVGGEGASLAGVALGILAAVDPSRASTALSLAADRVLPGLVGTVALAAVAYAIRGVGVSGALGGVVLGTTLYAWGDWRAFAMLGLFFVMGTAATRVAPGRKRLPALTQADGGRRSARHAFANGSVGAICAVLAGTTTHEAAWTAALVAAYATAAGDTVSSEIGQAFGRVHRLVTSLRRVPAGTDGAVSWVGTLAGLGAASLLAVAAVGVDLLPPSALPAVVVASQVGGAVDSYLGATAERAGWIGNHLVNFSNTVAGAGTAWGLVAWNA